MNKLLFILFFNFLMSDELVNNSELWSIIQKKFNIELAKDFSNQDATAWLGHFAPKRNINVYQYGKDVSGKGGEGKTIKLYSGSILSSIIRGRLPAKLMAKTVFKRLKDQDYQESKIELLGILLKNDRLKAYVRFERINTLGEVYQTARGIYTLIEIDGKWYISEMSTYDDIEEINALVGYDKMWVPGNNNY